MGQALHISGGLVSQIGNAGTLGFNNTDVISGNTALTICGAASLLTALNIATGTAVTSVNIGTGANTKTIQIGQGADTIRIGTTTGATAQIELCGDVHINGIQHVLGNTTFDEDITMGDARGDVITINGTMGAGLGAFTGTIPFVHGGSGFSIENGATQASLTLKAANNSAGEGGNVILTPGTGSTVSGSVVFGKTGGTAAGDFQLLADTNDATAEAGIRYNASTDTWELRVDAGSWTPIAAGGSMPNGTVDQLAQCVTGTTWTAISDVYMKWEAATTRELSVRAPVAADTNGGSIELIGGLATGTGAAGHTYVTGAPTSGSGAAGNVTIAAGASTSTGTTGDVRIYGGQANAGVVDGGDVLIRGGASTGGALGVTRLFMAVSLYEGATNYARVDLASGGVLTNSASGYTTGARFYDAGTIGMVWAARAEGWIITQETAAAGVDGGNMRLQGGHGPIGGGDAQLYGGDATVGGQGGGVTLTAGASIGAAGGAVSITASAGNGLNQNGGDVSITAGNASGTGVGGDIVLHMGVPGGVGIRGVIEFGPATPLAVADAYQFIANTDDATAEAGLRWNNSDNSWEVRYDGDTTWYDLLSAFNSAIVQPGTNVNDVLQWNGTQWEDRSDITLYSGGNRTIQIDASAAATDGRQLTLAAGDAGAGNQAGGALRLFGGNESGNGTSGAVYVQTQNAATGATGLVSIATGLATVGNSGVITLATGDTDGAAAFSGDINLTGGTNSSSGNGGSVGLAGGGTDSGTAGIVTLNGGPGNGTADGGWIEIYGGVANGAGNGGYIEIFGGQGTAGGSVYIQGGLTTDSTPGNVFLGNANTGVVQFGGTATTTYKFQGNVGNRLVAGSDGNTIVMDRATSHFILVAQAAAGNGQPLRIAAGQGAAGSNGGSLYLRGGSGTANGNVYLGDSTTAVVYLGAGSNCIQYTASTSVLEATGTGTINLKTTGGVLQFNGTTATNHANITGPNFTSLFSGTDIGTSLHYHSSAGGTVVPLTWSGVSTKQAVYVSAAATCAPADADNTQATSTCIGFATTNGFVQTTGIATGIADDTIAAGDALYLSTTAGRVTKVGGTGFPATGWLTAVGVATSTGAAGGDVSILLRIAPPIAL